MTSPLRLSVIAPSPPESWTPKPAPGEPISALVFRRLIPAGPAYIDHLHRVVNGISFEERDKKVAEELARKSDAQTGNGREDDLGVGDEPESAELLALDPKEWKKQDHYAVLGLSHLRWKANDEQIKIAHRKKVLKHHPDKKAGAAGETNDDAFFKCISKAMEVLSNAEKRRQYDSVDFGLEDEEHDVPTQAQISKAKDPIATFFRLYGPVFEREARFSRKQPVPLLGTYNDSKDEVERFYDFWYNFDSWRSFEYLDKEVNEGSDSRDDKRYTEKKNKSDRARRKKEDTQRLRQIVDQALAIDPRIKRIKQEEKEAREAKKKGKVNGTTGVAGKSSKAEEEMRLAEAKEKEEADKVAKADAKKAKAAAANAAKKARRAARQAEEATNNTTPTNGAAS